MEQKLEAKKKQALVAIMLGLGTLVASFGALAAKFI
jgi:hypothetical protein